MAVYCPIYDPVRGWYIIVCGPEGSQKKYIASPLNYYHSMGVKPPVGAKFTQEDYMNFEFDLVESEYLSHPALAPLSSLPAIPSLTTPISTNSTQAAGASMSEYDNLSDLKDPLLFSTFGPSSAIYSPFFNPSTSSAASSPQLSSTDSMLKNVVSLNTKLDAMGSFLSSSLYGGQSGSSLSLPTSPFTSSLAYPSTANSAEFNSNSLPKHPSTLSYLLPIPSTSSSLSHHLHTLPSKSSGYVNLLPPLNPQCPVHGATATNSSNLNNYPLSTADYDDSMTYEMYLDDVDKSAMEADEYDF